MGEGTKRLFVGLKVTKALQDDLANPAPGTKQYFEGTSDEYLQIIVPGTVEKGQAPRQITDIPRQFFWSLNDTKSRYAADAILDRFGGRHADAHTLRFSRGTTEYLWYVARGQVRLDLRFPDEPLPQELSTGTIAEVNGRYKFLAFQWDN